jgi:hypothetical protein
VKVLTIDGSRRRMGLRFQRMLSGGEPATADGDGNGKPARGDR